MAAELLQTYAFRTSRPGFAFPDDTGLAEGARGLLHLRRDAGQEKAIADVKGDMTSDRPMDRLVCGDVGYGKTEVAVRAAFKAVQAGKQVAVLVPPPSSPEQHMNTFSERLAPFPVRVEMLSRFRTPRSSRR